MQKLLIGHNLMRSFSKPTVTFTTTSYLCFTTINMISVFVLNILWDISKSKIFLDTRDCVSSSSIPYQIVLY